MFFIYLWLRWFTSFSFDQSRTCSRRFASVSGTIAGLSLIFILLTFWILAEFRRRKGKTKKSSRELSSISVRVRDSNLDSNGFPSSELSPYYYQNHRPFAYAISGRFLTRHRNRISIRFHDELCSMSSSRFETQTEIESNKKGFSISNLSFVKKWKLNKTIQFVCSFDAPNNEDFSSLLIDSIEIFHPN